MACEREDREKAAGKLQDEQTNKTNLHALRTQLDFVSNEKQGYKTSSEQLKREKAHLESRLADHQENLAAVDTLDCSSSTCLANSVTRSSFSVFNDSTLWPSAILSSWDCSS